MRNYYVPSTFEGTGGTVITRQISSWLIEFKIQWGGHRQLASKKNGKKNMTWTSKPGREVQEEDKSESDCG